MYYVLQCHPRMFELPAALGETPTVEGVESWKSGRSIVVPVPTPLVFELVGDEAYPEEEGVLLEMFQTEALLMTERLVNALATSGVDNLQIFDARLIHMNRRPCDEKYKVVNIVGTVACADLSRSTYLATRGRPLIDTDFDSLAIDDTRARGALMFRLAESLNTILVHERVRGSIESGGIDTLTFKDPAEYVG